MTASFSISAFGDEISKDLEVQLDTLTSLKIYGLDLRGALGKNVVELNEEDVSQVKKLCAQYGVRIACLGSPVGKSPLIDPIQYEMDRLEHLMSIGESLNTRLVRIFSFYPSDTSTNQHYDQHVSEAAERLGKLSSLAEKQGFILVLENEKGIVTDTPQRCLKTLQMVNSPALRFAWDPANFIQVGVAKPIDQGWVGLQPYIDYVHIKDARLADGKVTPAGEGDGQVLELLTNLKDMEYQGTLSLEPHLQIAGHSSGFSGAEGMGIAAAALRRLMNQVGCQEA